MENESKWRQTEPPDFFLELLLAMAEEEDKEVPITLNVRGLIISGFIISQKTYAESFGKGSFKATVLRLKESGKLDFLDDEAEPPEEGAYEYIHLKNAKIYAPGQHPIPAEGMLWRGRISSIDGYVDGMLGVGKPDGSTSQEWTRTEFRR
jgi:hypothetical protein